MRSRQHTVPVLVKDGLVEPLRPIPLDQRMIDEGFLQKLLFEHPELIPVEEIEPICADPIPLARELRTPDGPLDILYLNANGFLTLVETKLWRNPEARRAVVGQIIDYAKHVASWSYADLEEHVRQSSHSSLRNGQSLVDFIGSEDDDFDERHFVSSVERNLRLGRFLLLIIGDGVHEGVEQMTEFLNQTPQLGFQLALVEMPLFRLNGNDDRDFLVTPRVVARTKEITRAVVRVEVVDGQVKTDVRIPDEDREAAGSRLTIEAFLQDVEERDGKDAREFVEWALARAEERGIEPFLADAGVGLWYTPDGGPDFNLTHFGCRLSVTYVSIRHVTETCRKHGVDPSIGTDFVDDVARLLGKAKRVALGRESRDAALRLNDGKRPRIADFVRIKDGWLAALDRMIERLDAAFAEK